MAKLLQSSRTPDNSLLAASVRPAAAGMPRRRTSLLRAADAVITYRLQADIKYFIEDTGRGGAAREGPD